jgi:hypothetical protein
MKYPPGAPLIVSLLTLGCGIQEVGRPGTPPPASSGQAPATMAMPADAATVPAPVPLPVGPAPIDGGPSAPPPDTGTAPPPSTGTVGVMINGQFVPRERALVVLHIGHSNMAGRATGPAELKPFFYDVDPHLWVYGKGGFRAAQEPTAPDNEAGQAAGPGMALLHSVLAAAAPGSNVISVGHGHSGSFGGYCSNFRKGGLLYDVAMKPAMELKGKVTYVGIFTMFGQSEHNAAPNQQRAFADCLSGMAAEMRGDLGAPDLPFLVGDYEAGITRADILPTSAFARPIIAQIQMVPAKTPRSAIIPSTGLLMEDDHHYNMAGHKLWAERGIKILLDQGWAPWAAPAPAAP